ncbi:lytic transglycosylase domain-containing protein [Alicyclobacillus tolerans]|uniref:Soluble lytic murein transglycosylase n=3 Tax=Alicyclobacillus tolerans TaxID=90970 RepID=A0ABT9LUJ3_9BACL|nr:MULTISPECIES: lytic transglycosylase domain-containing protein [Alicyclobacillus]MDP9727935.1 soluble lytic murein transglycosylase [Alicyclobacillus tengchongensis]QRF24233.1 lytic transglycosylase domain-containing protein [Alicyclobacillus sp. TC]SHK62571.1 soluble lytic murein transglycosylase [Alicyclobacillus montanus]
MAYNSTKRMPRIIFVRRRFLVSLLLLISVFAIISSNTFWRWMYPISYQTTIQQSARAVSVDPLLVASIIRVESKFNKNDVSDVGAVGLMQLLPSTASWALQKMNQQNMALLRNTADSSHSLANPSVNIAIGSWYVAYLIQRFHGNLVAAVAAYNAGPRRVETWLEQGVWNGQLNTILNIPVGETRHFVDRVFYNYRLYQHIYGSFPEWQKG